MTKLSVNINKLATLRNARGGNNPDLLKAAIDIESYGADGITVHPRPDERHIRYADVYELKKIVTTEFNIEGYPDDRFLQLVHDVKPHQVTLVPDAPDVLTSNNGWDVIANKKMLQSIITDLQKAGMRVSIFMNPDADMMEHAGNTGTNRVELYTEAYATHYAQRRELAIANYLNAAKVAFGHGLGINAGHDLDLHNLKYFAQHIPNLLEVSIGHALICDAIYYGLQNAVPMYKRLLQ
ncbi:MAG: pyridoxine 5'-phosphate synthase [Bacteroidetes bacterium]|nr:pyridoxine 5'-phosphate synthase [Bacteroidota bacterium]